MPAVCAGGAGEMLANTIRDVFSTHGKFNWWDKTLSTQGNKAYKDAD
jgi:hypothetical protein